MPLYVGAAIIIVSIPIHFIIDALTASKCMGNAGCIIFTPLLVSPIALAAYGVSVIISFFIKKGKKFQNMSVYSLAFWLILIIGLIILVIFAIE